MPRIYSSVILTLLFAAAACAQTDATWQHLTSKSKDFSISVPQGFIINNEDQKTHILATVGDARFEITRRENRGRIDPSLLANDGNPNPNTKTETFGLGDFAGRWTTFDRGGRSTTAINAASSTHSISIIAHSKTSDDKNVSRLMASIVLDGEALFTIRGVSAPAASGSAVMDDLKSSPIVTEYLKKPVNKDVVVDYVAFGRDATPALDVATPLAEPANVTRPLMVLRKPNPAYAVSARRNRVSGSVRVKVTFLASGLIGSITADPTLDRDLAESAVTAAKNIKFIPAEVDGKAVDVTRQLVYGFSVY